MVLPLKIFTFIEFHIYIYIYIYIYMYFYSTPKKILSLCNLPLKNFICPQPVAGRGGGGGGGGDGYKCNSPIIPLS